MECPGEKDENSYDFSDWESVWINPIWEDCNWDFALEISLWMLYFRNTREVASGHVEECKWGHLHWWMACQMCTLENRKKWPPYFGSNKKFRGQSQSVIWMRSVACCLADIAFLWGLRILCTSLGSERNSVDNIGLIKLPWSFLSNFIDQYDFPESSCSSTCLQLYGEVQGCFTFYHLVLLELKEHRTTFYSISVFIFLN